MVAMRRWQECGKALSMKDTSPHREAIIGRANEALRKRGVRLTSEYGVGTPAFRLEPPTVHINQDRHSAFFAHEAGHATGWRGGIKPAHYLRGAAGLPALLSAVQAARATRDQNEEGARAKLEGARNTAGLSAGLYAPTVLEELRANKRAYGFIREAGLGRLATMKHMAPNAVALSTYLLPAAGIALPYFMARHSVAKRFGKPNEEQPQKHYSLP